MNPRTLSDECLSDFALDRRLGGELTTDEEARAREHVTSCPRCEQRWVARRKEHEAFGHEAPPFAAVVARAKARPRTARPRRPQWLAAAVGLMAASAAVAAIARRPADRPDDTRLKGDAWRIGFYVNHAGTVRAGGSGERLEPGDALRFTYRALDARYVAVLSIDGAKRASMYFPASGPPSLEPPGVDVALPLSTVLDGTLGDETIYGIGCPAPFDGEALRRALESSPEKAPAPAGCDVDRLLLHKEGGRSP
jgi:hypothetical protein